ncbi:MAG: DUF5611 family protein [Thermoplasmata archaeon]|nr:DUF5611 family protein [Thermoplasmata archaeon]
MQHYPVRPSHRRNLDGPALEAICRSHFDGVARDAEGVTGKWGAIERLQTRAEGKELGVELKMNPKVDESVAHETIRRYNAFLEAATGYNSKERAKRLRKSAGE